MKSLDKAQDVVRVERGVADESEVAAVVLVLLSRLAARRLTTDASAPVVDEGRAWWNRPDVYRAPRSWY